MDRRYLCIDLKSFYASVECADRGLDPFTTNLVVADPTRGDGTICLAITPAMKVLGVKNRCRVYEIPPTVRYMKVMPRMRRYMEVSAQIYSIYLRYLSPEDILVYSVDECFIDATPYLALYGKTARELAVTLMDAVFREMHIRATAGIGTNLFLAKVALDVLAKHAPDFIGYLDEDSFKCKIWHHRPITDIWGIGPGTARRLARYGVVDLAGVAMLPYDLLRREFGVNAEILFDHAWGIEPCTMADIHHYVPRSHSLSNGQVLLRDYTAAEARVVLREMVDGSALDLVEKGLACGSVSLFVGYTSELGSWSSGAPMPSTGTSRKLPEPTDSRRELTAYFLGLYDQIIDVRRKVRHLCIGVGALEPVDCVPPTLFTDVEARERERRLARTTLAVKRRYGKNALLRGTNFREGATGRQRNVQVGGHHE